MAKKGIFSAIMPLAILIVAAIVLITLTNSGAVSRIITSVGQIVRPLPEDEA